MLTNIKKIFFLMPLLLFGLLLFTRCAKPPLPECIKKSSEGLTIKWGTTDTATGETSAYELDSHTGLYKIYRKNKLSREQSDKITYIDPKEFCNLYLQINREILKTQVLNAPGDTAAFLEYTLPANSIFYRAVWNPKFVNVANKGFRAIYDSLMKIVPAK